MFFFSFIQVYLYFKKQLDDKLDGACEALFEDVEVTATKTSAIKAISIGEISELQLKFEGDYGTWPLEKIEIATKVERKTSVSH